MSKAYALKLAAVPAADFTIDFADVRQSIDGFGASDRDNGTLTTGQADLFFDSSAGIGLTLLRASIETDGTYYADPQNAVKAVARGAKVWGACWTPTASLKSNSSRVGGTLLSANYATWADTLCAFVTTMKNTYSVPVMAVSCQNEPDSSVPFDSCAYSSAQMIAFMKVFGPKLAALSPAPLLMAPETEQWSDLWGYADAIIADGTAGPMLGICATHDYSYATSTHADITARLWETEVSDFAAEDATIAHALTVAGWMHRALTVGKVNAWHYWSLVGINTDREGILTQAGANTKRLFAIGNYSKFVRPGWSRIAANGSKSNVSVSAYKSADGHSYAIVMVNNTGSASSCSFALSGAFSATVAPWVTSGTAIGAIGTDGNLSNGSAAGSVSASISLTGNNWFSATIPPGVTTFVGSA